MAITYEGLRDNAEMRKDFQALSLANKRKVFEQMPQPVGKNYSDSGLRGIQNQLIAMPSTQPQPQQDVQQQGGIVGQAPEQQGGTLGQHTQQGGIQSIQPDQDETPTAMNWRQVGSEAFHNFDDSAIEFAKSMGEIIVHPIQTGKQLFGLLAGVVEKAIPGEQKHEELVDAIGSFYKDRYGGGSFAEALENIKKTMAEDPVGFLSDASILVSGGATAVAKLAVTGSKVAKVAKVAQAAKFADPTTAVSAGVGKVIKGGLSKALGGTGPKATKDFNAKVKKHLNFKGELPDSDMIAKEFLARGLLLNRKSSQKLGISMKKIGREVDTAINNATKKGKKIKTDSIVKAFDDLADDLNKSGLSGANEPAFIKQLTKLRDEWKNLKGDTMTPRQLQDMKVSLGKKFDQHLGDEHGALKKKIDDGLRNSSMKELNKMFPVGGGDLKKGLKATNKEIGIQKDLKRLVDKRIEEMSQKGGFLAGGVEAASVAKAGAMITVGSLAGFAKGGAIGSAVGFVGMLGVLAMWSKPNNQIKLARLLARARNMKLATAKNIVAKRMNDMRKEVEKLAVTQRRAERAKKRKG